MCGQMGLKVSRGEAGGRKLAMLWCLCVCVCVCVWCGGSWFSCAVSLLVAVIVQQVMVV